MGLKRRNPGRLRLTSAADIAAEVPVTKAPAANAEVEPSAKKAAPPRRITNEERHQMIAKVAYRHAERTGFATDPVQNWLTAEREVDADLAKMVS